MKKILFFSFLLFQSFLILGSEVVSIRPINSRILLVHFDDGFIRYHKAGQTSENDIVATDPLNVESASKVTNYTITSTNDPNYSNNINPIEIGRKTKGTEFSGICLGWGFIPFFNDIGCINNRPDHVKEHWIYLFLPHPLKQGSSYTVKLNNLATNSNNYTITFDEKLLRSDAVHVNIIGYSTHAPKKYGYVYSWLGDKGSMKFTGYENSEFYLIDDVTKQIVHKGKIAFRKPANSQETGQTNDTPNQNFLGADVYECDFSNFNKPGEYRLVVEGFGCSYPFKIQANVLQEPFQAVMQGIYQNRSGIDLTMPYAQERPAPHNVQKTKGFAGKLKYTKTRWCDVKGADNNKDDKPLWESGIIGNLTKTWGWYQDAGDWDGYLNHMKIPTYLMFLYEQYPNSFKDGDIIIPESGNGQPDILDEARWLLRFYKRLKDELTEKKWGTGGIAGSRIFGDLWGEDKAPNGTGRGSWADTTRTWVVSGEDPYLSYWYAGATAHYHYLLKLNNMTDVENINWLSEAEAAYTWAEANSKNDNTCHDFQLKYLRAYASVSLYKATGNDIYHTSFLKDAPNLNYSPNNVELTDYFAYAAWQYCSLPSNLQTHSSTYNGCKASILATADFQLLFSQLDGRACRWGGNFWFPMLVGQPTTPLVREGVMAMALFRNSDPAKSMAYKTAIHNTADYFLGNNPLNMTWITGLGENSPKDIFHLDSWYSPSGGVRKGINVYGPWRREYYTHYGWWRAEWPAMSAYPSFDSYPGHERWFSIRTAPLTSEFTIHQNNLTSAFVYGALIDDRSSTVNTENDATKYEDNNGLIVIPNPSSDYLKVILNHSTPQSYTIFNTIGQTIRSGNLDDSPINIATLSSGLYILNILDNKGVQRTTKFLKQ